LSPEHAADVYEAQLKNLFPGDPFPCFDLVLLGLGEDGHFASLFPGSSERYEEGRWVAATEEYMGLRRVTLTLPVLASARRLLFLVSGQEKARALGLTLASSPATGAPRPSARILLDLLAAKALAGSERPEVTWLVDRAAASLLPPE
jgi:6-phosphogluconolactonase